MLKAHTFPFKNVISKNALTIKAGLLTAVAIVFFKIISLFVLYQYIRADVYLCFVAILFFAAGIYFNRNKKVSEVPLPATPDIFLLLSAREIQILTLIAEGKTNKEIAAIQFIELSTVKTHINNMYARLSVTNRKEARSRYHKLKPNNWFL